MKSRTVLYLIVTSLAVTRGWVLNVNKVTVTPHLTNDVTMKCDNNSTDSNKDIVTLYRIRLSKFTKDNVWKSVAALTSSQTGVISSLTDAIVSGRVDKLANSFLEVKFEIATDQTIGQFICEVDGFNSNEDIKVTRTSPVIIVGKVVTYDELLKTVLDLKEKENDDVNDLKNDVGNINDEIATIKRNMDEIYQTQSNITRTLQQVIERLASQESDHILTTIDNVIESQMSQTYGNLSTRINEMNINLNTVMTNLSDHQKMIIDIKDMTTFETSRISSTVAKLTCCSDSVTDSKIYNPVNAWPEGNYILLEPKSGCPNTPTTRWKQGSISISTGPLESDEDSKSFGLELAGSVLEEFDGLTYVMMTSCRMQCGGQGVKWPKGSYCLQSYKSKNNGDRSCPSDFYYGFIKFGRYDDGKLDDAINVDVFRGSSYTEIPFCCRNDGSVNESILLPALSPFYLYRYGGECQHVVGMDVKEQWIYLATGRWGVNNAYYASHPDGTNQRNDKGVQIQLCYYTPRG